MKEQSSFIILFFPFHIQSVWNFLYHSFDELNWLLFSHELLRSFLWIMAHFNYVKGKSVDKHVFAVISLLSLNLGHPNGTKYCENV